MRFFKKSLRYKLIVLLLLSTVIPIVTSIVITYVYTKKSIEDRSIQENIQLMSQGNKNISNYLESINKASLVLYSNPTGENFLSDAIPDYKNVSNILSGLQLVSRSANDIIQVFLYLAGTQQAYLLHQDDFNHAPSTNLLHGTTIEPYAAKSESTHLNHTYGMQLLSPLKPELVFTLHRPLYRVPSSERIGLLDIDVKLDTIKNLSKELYTEGKENFYIIDNAGAVVYASNEVLIGQTLSDPWIENILSKPNTTSSMEWKEKDFSGIVIYSKIDSKIFNWMLVKRIPYNQLYKQANNLTMMNSIMASFFLILAIIIIVIVSIKITRPIKQLIRSINKITAGQMDEPIEIYREDEIGILARRFRTMMHTINDSIFREYKLEMANKTTQLKMLQAQINPHFLNNALQSIGNQALESNAPHVYSLVSALGQMMHYSMNTQETIVSLSKEIDYVTYYLELQQERFEDRFHYEFDIEESTYSIPIPKMILQPIVENYFKHGFNSLQSGGILLIKSYIHDGNLFIIVEDNGSGIPDERLQWIKDNLSEPENNLEEHGGSIGLLNVMLRLRLYYGELADIVLSNREQKGIQVQVKIPLKEVKWNA